MTHGAVSALARRPATKVVVFQLAQLRECFPKKRRRRGVGQRAGVRSRRPWLGDVGSQLPAHGIGSRRRTRPDLHSSSRVARRCRTALRSCAPWQLLLWPCRCAPRAVCRRRLARYRFVPQFSQQAGEAPRPDCPSGVCAPKELCHRRSCCSTPSRKVLCARPSGEVVATLSDEL